MAAPVDSLRGYTDGALLLEKLPLERAEKFLNELGASLSGKQKDGPQSNQYAELSPLDFQASTKALSELFRNHCLSPSSNSADLAAHTSLSTPYKEKIRLIFSRHEDDLKAHLQRGTSLPKQILCDFDWTALIVAASSHLSSQETPLLRLSLSLETHSGSSDSRRTSVEFSMSELDSTIAQLQNCIEA
ncbi:uncharacterized protein LOC100909035 [Galendromus occidentalis]|uniref:Uncharacterized protein LOC100909035 n=1 Tax=Galendromus occidentalis TaxID=34638 RepID=A0AAJ6W059_9ACAR|nr:uncharacterized protein LOC100909035 [Galendromus occidentalis]